MLEILKILQGSVEGQSQKLTEFNSILNSIKQYEEYFDDEVDFEDQSYGMDTEFDFPSVMSRKWSNPDAHCNNNAEESQCQSTSKIP